MGNSASKRQVIPLCWSSRVFCSEQDKKTDPELSNYLATRGKNARMFILFLLVIFPMVCGCCIDSNFRLEVRGTLKPCQNTRLEMEFTEAYSGIIGIAVIDLYCSSFHMCCLKHGVRLNRPLSICVVLLSFQHKISSDILRLLESFDQNTTILIRKIDSKS